MNPSFSSPPGPGRAGGVKPELLDLLRRRHREARRLHPELAVPFEAFATHALERVRGRLERAGVEPAGARDFELLARLRAGDLYLALACDRDAPGALQALERRHFPRLRGLLLARGASSAEAAELLADLPAELCSPPPRGAARTRLGTYEGSGTLFGWLAVIALRRLSDRARRPAAAALDGHPEVAAMALPPSADPARAAGADESVQRVELALRGGWKLSLIHI